MQQAFASSATIPTPPCVPMEHRVARLATDALLAEARLTPKPGLVDGRGPGAHADLSLALLETSACVLEPHFAAMARAAQATTLGLRLREKLGSLGRNAERAMLQATGGVNTHRGAIWALGLLVAASASGPNTVYEFCSTAATLAALPDSFAVHGPSHGTSALRRFGAQGARGEAVSGFPHVHAVGLPALRHARRCGATETQARLDALLSIMSTLEDTCLLHRGGTVALTAAQSGAKRVLALGGAASALGRRALVELDAKLLSLWASPGGSADLLAATLFVDSLLPIPLAPVLESSHA